MHGFAPLFACLLVKHASRAQSHARGRSAAMEILLSVLNHVCCAIVTTKPDVIKDPTTATACIHGMSNEAKNQILSCSL